MSDLYDIELSRRARRYLERLGRPDHDRVIERLRELAEDPYRDGTRAMSGVRGARRARIGARRIVYRVDEARRRVEVAVIGPRGDVYKDL